MQQESGSDRPRFRQDLVAEPIDDQGEEDKPIKMTSSFSNREKMPPKPLLISAPNSA